MKNRLVVVRVKEGWGGRKEEAKGIKGQPEESLW